MVHTSLGTACHNTLADMLTDHGGPDTLPGTLARHWTITGWRDQAQENHFKLAALRVLHDYLTVWHDTQPAAIERSIQLPVDTHRINGRVDRVDLHPDGGCTVIDYKFPRRPIEPDTARTSLALYVYAQAAERIWRRPTAVALHDVTHGQTQTWEWDSDGRARKQAELEHAVRAAAADAERAHTGATLPATVTALCGWCPYQDNCPEGQTVPSQPAWAGIEPDQGPAWGDPGDNP